MEIKGLRVAILATDMYEESELLKPREALDAAGAETLVVAPHDGELQGAQHHDKAGTVAVDELLEDANPEEFDAVLLPGGALNADELRANEKAQQFVKSIDESGKPIAVICHGPWLIVSAGLVKGRTLTSFPTIADDIENAGGHWVDEEVCQDKNWVSSRKPDDIPAFNEAMLELFTRSSE